MSRHADSMALASRGTAGSMVHAWRGVAPSQSVGSPRPVSSLLLTLLVLLGSGAVGVEGWTSASCGSTLEGPHGYFHSPNFPRQFDTPLLCHWVIHAPPNHKIILYFTQFYLKESFHLTEYTTYNGRDDHTGEKPLADISYRNEIKYVASYRPYVVVNFNVHTMRNMHLRVDEHLMDVFGFNITYEIVPRDQEVRNDTCTVQDCSYLGNCVISADYSTFSCECFEGFFGKECQYGPYCDPDRGINSCDNGGQCRYYYGSLVNTCECPPGFEGVRCETLQTHNDACVRLGCSQSCRLDEGSQGYCVCHPGYKLQPDNVTCIEKEMYIVTVTVEVFKFLFAMPTSRVQSILREHADQMEKILDGISNITFEKFYSGHISYVKPWYVWQFRVLVERQQEEEAVVLLPGLVQQGVCMAGRAGQSRCGTINITSNPEMKLLTVENYDQRPALEGKLLTIACSARGSANLQFQWLKDGSPINMTWPDRNMWEVRIPPTTENKQMSVLNIDDVTIYDRGVFTCVIRDQGQMQNKTVMVDVITLPLVELTPPSANLEPGRTVEIRCLSPEDTRRTFTYEWLANGVSLGAADPNYFIEELFPTGLMLEIRAAKPSTNFTCRVRNEAGTTSLSATVFVIPENTTRGYCERVTGGTGLVKWDKTYDGNYDVQNCPVDSGDMLISRIGNGYSTRRCSCDDVRGCVWAEPNLARCQSGRLIEIYDELEKLRIGYQSNTSGNIFDSLYRLICRARSKLIAGDVDFTAAILHSLVHTVHQHPFLAPTQGLFNLTNMLDFMNILLEEGLSSNIDEIRDLYTGMRLLHIATILSEMQLGIEELRSRTVVRGKMEVGLTYVTVNDTARAENDQEGDGDKNFTRQRQIRETGEDAGVHEVTPRTLPAFKFIIRDIYHLLKIQGGERPDYLSDLVILQTAVRSPVPPSLDSVTVNLQHRLDIGLVMGGNETVCLRWIETKMADDGVPATARSIGERSLYGRWTREGCHVISMTPTNTTCSCTSQGIFSLTLQPRQMHVELLKEKVYDAVLLAGCLVTALALLVALLVHIITCRSRHRGQRMSPLQQSASSNTRESTYGVQFDWRDMIGDHHFTHLNLILCLCVINLLSLLCLYQYDSQSMCMTGKVLMQLFYLGAFSFLFVKTIQVFVDILNAKRMEKGCLKYFLIGWGIPILMTMAVVVGSEVSEKDSTCSRWCVFTEHHWQFFVFLICAICLFMVQTAVQIYCFVRIMKWENEDRFMDRRKHLATMALCLTSSSLLTVMAVVGSMADTRGEPAFSWVFIMADLLLTVVTLVYFWYLNHQIRRALRSIFCRGITQSRSSSSFRAYMMPEKVEEKPESPEETIQKYYVEVDRAKYTAEHKRRLRFLLGSSAAGGEEVVQPLRVGPGFRDESGAHGGIAQVQEFVVDSGYSEGTDSDRSSFKQMMEIEPYSGPSSLEKDCDVRFLSDVGCSRV